MCTLVFECFLCLRQTLQTGRFDQRLRAEVTQKGICLQPVLAAADTKWPNQRVRPCKKPAETPKVQRMAHWIITCCLLQRHLRMRILTGSVGSRPKPYLAISSIGSAKVVCTICI